MLDFVLRIHFVVFLLTQGGLEGFSGVERWSDQVSVDNTLGLGERSRMLQFSFLFPSFSPLLLLSSVNKFFHHTIFHTINFKQGQLFIELF